jgi:hypothetical protein
MPKLRGRQIHCHRERSTELGVPGTRLPAGFAQHPLTEWNHQPGFFGERDEGTRPYESLAGVAPAQQCFRRRDSSSPDGNLRLVVKLEFADRERAPQIVFERQALL